MKLCPFRFAQIIPVLFELLIVFWSNSSEGILKRKQRKKQQNAWILKKTIVTSRGPRLQLHNFSAYMATNLKIIENP